MLGNLLLAVAFQIGPFYQRCDDGSAALRPVWSSSRGTTDVLWPLFTSHRDWWRCLFLAHYLENDGGYQFSLFPVWWNGKSEETDYFGLFPLYGRHPHLLGLYDASFALWPLYHSYSTVRPRAGGMRKTRSFLFPFFHYRDDGSWGAWPFYVRNFNRESFHETFLWPVFTRASYEEDRDTPGEGYSWMLWPLAARVERSREKQYQFLPPFFSCVKTVSGNKTSGVRRVGMRLRLPWPFFEIESTPSRERISVFPFYERVGNRRYSDGAAEEPVTRFGWRLVELLPGEKRVFPFWVKGEDYFRLWPFWETKKERGVFKSRFLSLFPIRHVPAVDRNWAKFWTLYEREEDPLSVSHSLLWGIIGWKNLKD